MLQLSQKCLLAGHVVAVDEVVQPNVFVTPRDQTRAGVHANETGRADDKPRGGRGLAAG